MLIMISFSQVYEQLKSLSKHNPWFANNLQRIMSSSASSSAGQNGVGKETFGVEQQARNGHGRPPSDPAQAALILLLASKVASSSPSCSSDLLATIVQRMESGASASDVLREVASKDDPAKATGDLAAVISSLVKSSSELLRSPQTDARPIPRPMPPSRADPRKTDPVLSELILKSFQARVKRANAAKSANEGGKVSNSFSSGGQRRTRFSPAESVQQRPTEPLLYSVGAPLHSGLAQGLGGQLFAANSAATFPATPISAAPPPPFPSHVFSLAATAAPPTMATATPGVLFPPTAAMGSAMLAPPQTAFLQASGLLGFGAAAAAPSADEFLLAHQHQQAATMAAAAAAAGNPLQTFLQPPLPPLAGAKRKADVADALTVDEAKRMKLVGYPC